jgi:hypothetical protein
MKPFVLPPEIQTFLDFVQDEIDPTSFLAGSAIRDILFGRTPYDWDIVLRKSRITADVVDRLWSKGLRDTCPTRSLDGYDLLGLLVCLPHPEGIYRVDMLAYDIDALSIPTVLDHIDWGLSRVALEPGTDRIIFGEGFVQDAADKMFRLRYCPSARHYASSMRRVENWSGKYPDFGVDIPAEIEVLYG